MASNPTGISTGQGKGEAQVFGDTYNDYFKQKADAGAKKKAEIETALAQSTAGVWDRVQFINSSKAAKKFYEQNLALYNKNPESYSDFSKADLQAYASTPGDFGSNIFLEGNFDPRESLNAMSSDLKGVQYTSDGNPYELDLGGAKYAVHTSSQRKEAAKEILDAQIARDRKMYRRQADRYWTPQEIANQQKRLEDSLGKKLTYKQEGSGSNPYGTGYQKKLDLAEQLRKDAYLLQVYTDGSDEVMQRWAASDPKILSIQHTMSDEGLKKKYAGAGGIVVRRDSGDGVREDFIPSKDYDTFLTNLRKTRLYANVDQAILDKVPGYSPTASQQADAALAPDKPYATQDVTDANTLLSNLPTGKVGLDFIEGMGLTSDLYATIKNKLSDVSDDYGEVTEEKFIETVTPILVAKSKTYPVTEDEAGNKTGGKLVNIEKDGDDLKFYFSSPEAVADKYNYITIEKTDSGYDMSEFMRELFSGAKENKVSSPKTKAEKLDAATNQFFTKKP